LGLFPLSAALADVLTINAAPSVERNWLKERVCAPLGGAELPMIELYDSSSKGLRKSVVISCE
jgi:hypothetical protein